MTDSTRRHVVPATGRLLPLLRTSLTVCAPWDSAPVTLELIGLAEGGNPDDVTASVEDVPELAQAGWQSFATPTVNLYVRVVN